MRMSKINELPQLLNIFGGTGGIIGIIKESLDFISVLTT